jgi:hypothetical protein
MQTDANQADRDKALKAAQAQWDIVVKVAAERAAEQGIPVSEAEMPHFSDLLNHLLRDHLQKQAAEAARPGIYATVHERTFGKTASVDFRQAIRQSAVALASDPDYAAAFGR